MTVGPAPVGDGRDTGSDARPGWRRSGWVTAAEVLLGLCFTVGLLGCLLMAVLSTVTFFGESVTPLMRSGERAWEQRAMWFAVGPPAAGVVLASVARRRSAGWVFGTMLVLGLLVFAGLGWPDQLADLARTLRDRLLR